MTEITYNNLIELGFIDHAKNGFGCRISIDENHEIAWYKQDKTIRYQTKGSGFTTQLNCINLSDVMFAYHHYTGKHLTYNKITHSLVTDDQIIKTLIRNGVLKTEDIEAFFNLQITRDGYTGTVKNIIKAIKELCND